MASIVFYRYIDDPTEKWEIKQLQDKRLLTATNPTAQGTWYTPDRYENRITAQLRLALNNKPSHRVGPIPADEMPDFDIPLRPVAPTTLPDGTQLPGGGVEARTTGKLYIFGLYDFINNRWVPLHT